MNREEAIRWMEEEKSSFEHAPALNGCQMTKEWQDAIDVYSMAISALRQQELGADQDSCKNQNIEPAWKRQFMRTFLGGR